jgi:hypothetical protein
VDVRPGPGDPDGELAARVTFTGAELDRKVAAVRAHLSQTAGLVEELGEEDFRRWWYTEAFVAARPAPSSRAMWTVASSRSA